MKSKKNLIISAVVGSLALVGGASAYQLYPRQANIETVADVAPVETKELEPVPTEQPAASAVSLTVDPTEENTVIQTQEEEVPASPQPINSEALTRAILPMIAKSNTTGGSAVTNEAIHQFILKTYETNPAPFTPNSLQSVVDICTNHLLEKYKELAGQPLAFTRYKINNICPL